jgi:hypothetical protein
MHPPDPTKKAALAGRPVRKLTHNNTDHTEITPKLQASRSVSRFGLALETAVTISQLAWGVCR